MTFSWLSVFIIVDTDQKNVASITLESGRIIPGTDLVQRSVGGHFPFELDHENWKFEVLLWQIDNIGISGTGRQFFKEREVVICAEKSPFDRAAETLLAVVMQRRFFGVDFLDLCGNSIFIHVDDVLDEFVAFEKPADGFILAGRSDSTREFHADLIIWNSSGFCFGIVCKVSEMDEESQNIVPIPEGFQIVRKSGCQNRDGSAADEIGDDL